MDDDLLVRLLLADTSDHAATTRSITETFLRLGSATPDNLNAVERIEYGRVDGNPGYAGLKLRGRSILLTDLAHALEDAALPREIRAYYPELTDGEWRAATRMITMLLAALDRPVH